jgi:hypothetical protein
MTIYLGSLSLSVKICACSRMLLELVVGLVVPREVQKMVYENVRNYI